MDIRHLFRRESGSGSGDEMTEVGSRNSGGNYPDNGITIYSNRQALSVSAWHCAQERLCNTMAQVRIRYQRRNSRAHGGNYDTDMSAQGRHLNYLLSVQPNPCMTISEFLKQLTLQRFVEGNGVVYIERDPLTIEVRNLWLCHTASYSPSDNAYFITYNRYGQLISKKVSAEDVLHWRNTFSDDYGMTGIGTLTFAAQALSLAATNDQQAMEISSKGGKLKLLITEDNKRERVPVSKTLNQAQRTKQQDNLQRDLDNGKDVLLLSGNMSVTVISQSAENQQLLETRKFDIPTVARFTGVPPQMLMDYANNSYKAPDQAAQDFILRTIAPMLSSLLSEMNAKLIGEAGYPNARFYADTDELLLIDPKTKADIAAAWIQAGIMCPNELRRTYNLPDIADGDRHYVSANLKPLNE